MMSVKVRQTGRDSPGAGAFVPRHGAPSLAPSQHMCTETASMFENLISKELQTGIPAFPFPFPFPSSFPLLFSFPGLVRCIRSRQSAAQEFRRLVPNSLATRRINYLRSLVLGTSLAHLGVYQPRWPRSLVTHKQSRQRDLINASPNKAQKETSPETNLARGVTVS